MDLHRSLSCGLGWTFLKVPRRIVKRDYNALRTPTNEKRGYWGLETEEGNSWMHAPG